MSACAKTKIFFEFDLNLTKIQFSAKEQIPERMYKVQFFFFKFDLSLTKIHLQLKNQKNAGAHVQCQTQFFEFDLSLTKIQFSTKNKSQIACTKSNSIFLSLT